MGSFKGMSCVFKLLLTHRWNLGRESRSYSFTGIQRHAWCSFATENMNVMQLWSVIFYQTIYTGFISHKEVNVPENREQNGYWEFQHGCPGGRQERDRPRPPPWTGKCDISRFAAETHTGQIHTVVRYSSMLSCHRSLEALKVCPTSTGSYFPVFPCGCGWYPAVCVC